MTTLTLESSRVLSNYPLHRIETFALRDGRTVTIRPVRHDDATLVQSFVRSLSPASRRNRFHHALNDLSESSLRYLTYIDYRRHLGLVLTVANGAAETMIGEARYVVGEDGVTAEFAVAVHDRWQGKGLADRMLAALLKAAQFDGLRWMVGEVLETNARMLRFMQRWDFVVSPCVTQAGVVRVERSVGAPLPHVCRSARSATGTLRRWLQRTLMPRQPAHRMFASF